MRTNAILADCKSFYYVYCLLEQEGKVPIYEGDQEKFEKELSCYCKKQMEQPAIAIPKWTNGALAAELALKFLFAKEQKIYSKQHCLDDLFYHLPEIHKTELLIRIKEQTHQTEEMIEAQLPVFSDAFIKSRYFFEYGTFGLTGLFDPFVKIVCEYALELTVSPAEI